MSDLRIIIKVYHGLIERILTSAPIDAIVFDQDVAIMDDHYTGEIMETEVNSESIEDQFNARGVQP